AYMACGHNSVLQDNDGRWYLFYHARFNDGSEYHEVRVHSMYFNEEGWPVVAPFEYSGDVMAAGGYEAADIAGEYEFINHGNSTDGNIINSQKITLSDDGKISGAVTGTWTEAADSAAAVITIGGKSYSGYFLAAQDESGKKVMSFTAVGNSNQTIWGAKTTEFTGTERTGSVDFSNADYDLVYAPETVGESSVSTKISGTELLSGVSYFISNKNSNMLLDLPNGELAEGTNIQQWEKNGTFAQQWRIVSVDNDYCRIVSLGDESKCIAVAENSANNGVNIELQTYNGSDNQLWKVVKNGSYYGIISKCSGNSAGLDVYEWSEENGGNINQWEFWGGDCQLWSIVPVYPTVNGGEYTIISAENGLPLSDGSSAKWNVTKQTEGYIIESESGNYLSLDSSGNIGINSSPQMMMIRCNKDGSYSFYSNEIESSKFIIEPVEAKSEPVVGDVNADGKFNIADLVTLQQWLLDVPDVTLTDWQAGDLCEDGNIDIFDMIMMRKLILTNNDNN
ncbi:MAG: RICIN domain-containing protein, partial [Ruminococcus sp.]|nr:RICIN domain-containing protein [Ruminococcus sp.]